MPAARELLVRAVRWARLPGHGHTIAQACAKFGITPSAYRRAAREWGEEARLQTDEELLMAGLYPDGCSVENLIYYYDWINHAGITAAEVRAILKRLMAAGWVRKKGAIYRLAREWP
jgi:transposase-like protein